MEVYVDDMLVKSPTIEQHVQDLANTFSALKLHNMKLNLEKFMFGVEAGKFLDFMVLLKGIEVNSEKIHDILDMQPLRSIKGVQKLAGRIAALNQFASKSTDKCLHFLRF